MRLRKQMANGKIIHAYARKFEACYAEKWPVLVSTAC